MNTCYSAPSRFLLRGAPDYSADTESEFHAEAHEDTGNVDTGNVQCCMVMKRIKKIGRTSYDTKLAPYELSSGVW